MNAAARLAMIKFGFLNPIKYYNVFTLIFMALTAISAFIIDKTGNGWAIAVTIAFAITVIYRTWHLITTTRQEFKKPLAEALDRTFSKTYFQQVFLKNYYKEEFNNATEENKFKYYRQYASMIAHKSVFFEAPQSYLSEISTYDAKKATECYNIDYDKCEQEYPDFINKINNILFDKTGLLALAIADNNVALLKFLKKQKYVSKDVDVTFILQFNKVLEEGQIEYKMTQEMAQELTETNYFNSLKKTIKSFILAESKKVGFDTTILKEEMPNLVKSTFGQSSIGNKYLNQESLKSNDSQVAEVVTNTDNLSSFSILLSKQFNELYQDAKLNGKLNTIIMYQTHLKTFLAEFEKANPSVNFVEDSLFINNSVAQFLDQIKDENELALQIKKVNEEFFNVSKEATRSNLEKKLDALIEKLQSIQNRLTLTLSENLMNMQEVGNKVLSAKS